MLYVLEFQNLAIKQKSFFLRFLTNYNLLFKIKINNFSDSDDNKIKYKKIKKGAIQSRRPLLPYFLVLKLKSEK